MTLVRYEPFGLLDRFHHDLRRFFDDAASETAVANPVAWIPSVDVREEDNRFVVHADLPGVDRKDLEIVADKGVLTIKGERRAETRSGNASYERIERVAGKFLRRFTLPESAQADEITAKLADGVLEVSIPKRPEVQPRRIEVKAA